MIIELSQSHLLYYVHIAYPGLGQAASHYTYVKVERADKVRKAGDEARDGVPGVCKQERYVSFEKIRQ